MASNGEIETEDTEINENNGEKVVTMMDVLQEQEDFEEDANAVLGASDDKNCTYALGYIKRQAIYACMTCCTEAKDDPTKRAGVCLACSLTCHENHELIELYTKRNFRCDCGNPKFNSHPCQFTSNKTDLNEENRYNQNFSGVYCVCHRPYPDPEASEEDEMIQCIMCEDWLHASHLEATVPSAQYAEMICKGCMQNNDFLHDYSDLALNTENDCVDVVSLNKSSPEINGTNEDKKNESEENTKETGQSSVDIDIPNKNSDENKDDVLVNEPKVLVDKAEEEKVTNDNLTTPSDTNDQTESNTTMDTDNAELSTTKAQQATKSDDNIDTPSEIKISTSENVILENKGLVEGNDDDSHINDIKEVVESSEEPTKLVNIEESIEEENKDSIVGNIEPNPISTEPKVPDANVGESTEMEISNDTDNDKAIDDKLSSAGSNTSASENLKDSKNDNINETDNNSNTATETNTDNTSTNEENKSIKEDTQFEKPKDVIQSVDASNIANSSESSNEKSEEELEKLEEDKLLADPDDSNQKEITVSNYKSQVNESAKEVCIPNSHGKSNDLKNSGTIIPNTVNVDLEKREETTEKNNSSHDTIIDNSTHISENKNIISGSEMEITNETTNSIDKDTEEANEEKPEIKRKLSVESPDSEAKKRRVDPVECKRPKDTKRQYKGATFWPSHFRQKLCTCSECLSVYKDLSVLFIVDPEDTVTAYENLGKEKSNGKPQSQYEKGLQALSSLDRIQQINVLTEYNKMRDKFLDFLKSFKDRRKIVTEDDVKAFFAGMKPTKRPDGVYFCR